MSYVVGTLFLSASLLVFGLTFAGVLFVSFTRARRKGYHPPGAVLIILAGWAVGIATRIAWDPLNFVARGGPGAGNVDFVWVPLLASADFFWLPLLFSALATAVLIGASPQRKLRVFGQRQVRFPFIGVGQVLVPLLLFGAMVVLYVSHNLKLSNALNVGAFLFVIVILAAPTALYLINRGRRIKGASSFDRFLDRETESLVLYLRPFNQESKFFVIGKASDYGAYAKSWHAKVSGDQFNIGITLEEYLADTITDLIGPFVALGSPEDYVPPEGALRMYAKDSEWMDQLDQLAKRSTCIIVQLASSDNLRWEFEHLRHEGLQQKLFIITPQSREGTRFQWAFFDLLWYLKGIRSVSWRAFSDDLAKLGYDLGFEDPGSGSVIGFEAEGRGVLLTTQANRPAEFVEPISVWLAERRIIGRSVRASCLSCGQMFYGFPTRAGTVRARFCRNCETGLTSRQLTWLSLYFPLIMLSWVLVVVGLARWMPEEAWLGGIAALIALVMLFFVLLAREKRRVAQRVVERYRKIAEEGDAIAMTYLGALYHRGREGLAKDDVQAVAWFRKAAEAGDPPGMDDLGFMYKSGRGGLSKDEDEALRWYRKAAEAGDPTGMFEVGVCYDSGCGVSKDEIEAGNWYRKAAAAGDANGMNNLGVMYEHGQGGLVKNEAEAVSWYQKAAHLGNVTAKRNLTRLQNAEAARQAVEVGDTEAVRGGGELTVSRLP